VVASQWSVDDVATSRLMMVFYQSLLRGARKDEALRQAMLAVKHSLDRARPEYWAAFEVLGDTTPLLLAPPH
jgi:CHAT domain-containing protein